MLVLKKIAITGGLSCGKSTVGKLFEDHGAYLLDSDKIVHNLLKDNNKVQSDVTELLGPSIWSNGQINRKKIAEIVFKNPLLLTDLEKILHPRVRDEIENKFKEISKQKNWKLFVVEIPLLFESSLGFEKDYDYTIAVLADPHLSKERFGQKYPIEEFEKRSKRQLSNDEKAKKANFVIFNNGNLENLKQKFNQVYSQITK